MPGATSYGWRQAIDGGGFQNAFDVADNAVHTSYPNSALSGADVAGIHYTKTRQANCIWVGANRGQIGWPQSNLSCVAYSLTTDGRAYAISGRGGNSKTFLISADGGQSWSASGFDIGADSRTSGTGAARPSGRMICPDRSGNYVWVAGLHVYGGSKQWGLARSNDQGATFTAGFAMGGGGIPNGARIRFVVQHPDDPTIIYCGVDGGSVASHGGLYRVDNAKATPSVTKIAGPSGISSLVAPNWFRDAFCVMEGTTPMMYFVAGEVVGSNVSNASVYRYNLSGGMIANMSSGDLDGDSQWTAIDGYRKGSNTVIWAGCWEPKATSGGRVAAVVVSRNGGSTWDKLSSITTSDTMPSGRKWWLLPFMDSFYFNKGGYDCAALRVDPNNTDIVYCAGRAGVWRTTDDGATWRPVMEQLAVSMDEGSVYNPQNKSQIMAGNVDWNAVLSDDKFTYGKLPVQKQAAGGGECSGLGSYWSAQGLVVGWGGRSDKASRGMVTTSTNPFVSGKTAGMTNQGWMAHIADEAKRLRVTAVVDGESSSGNRVLLAVAQFSANDEGNASNSGIWRKEITVAPATGTWVQVESGAFTQRTVQNTQRSTFYWPTPVTNPTVYTYDRKQGKLWRSNDRGVNWTAIWTVPGGDSSGASWAGYLAGASASLVYVSTDKHVYRISNANTSPTAVALNKPAALTAPGPIAVDDDGWLYVTQRNGMASIKTGLWRYDNAAGGNTAADWDSLTTNEFLGKVAFPQSMDVITEGAKKTILIDCWGNGLYIGESTDTPPPEELGKFAENFENKGILPADGTAITPVNSNFLSVTGSPTFTSNSQEGSRSGLFAVGAVAGVCAADSAMLTPSSKYTVDCYLAIQSLPSVNTRFIGLRDGNGTVFTGVQLTPTGNIIVQDGAASIYTSVMALEPDTWYRIAVKWDADTNQATLKLWEGDNLLAATPTEASGPKSYTNSTNIEQVRVGVLSSVTVNTAVLLDDIMTKDDGGWPDRGSVSLNHAMQLSYMPMGIKPTVGPDPLPPGGYITIMFGRTNFQALVGGSPIPGKTKTIMDAAIELQARGLFGVGGVVMDRTQQSVRESIGFYTSASWDDMANLRDNFGWHFVSQSKSYTQFADNDTDHKRYVESGQTLITLEGKGHMNGWGCFNYPSGPQGPAAGPAIVNQYFAGGRQYCTLTKDNTKASLNLSAHKIFVYSTKGGRCNDASEACYTVNVNNGFGNPEYHDSPKELADYLSPPPGVWHIIQFYRFVDGANGSLAAGTSNWDCSSADWRKRWTGQPELFPWKSFIEALDMRTTDAKCVHPAEMATLWDRIPPRPHGTPGY